MGKSFLAFVLLAILPAHFLFLSLPDRAFAEVKVDSIRAVESKGTPVDTAFSLDGQSFFVLNSQGSVAVYSSNGTLKHTFDTGFPADRISVSKSGETIVLSDSKTGKISQLELTFIQDINIQGSPFMGPDKAPVAVVVFTDFQCPYCAKAVPLIEQIHEDYPEQVKIVFKNFPLRMHPFAMPAAIAAMAAHNQGKFWQMHDLLFDNTSQLSNEKIQECARLIGLDMEIFSKDIKDRKMITRILTDQKGGILAGVRGTPTIFVNGQKLKRRGIEGFKTMIDRELDKLIKGQ